MISANEQYRGNAEGELNDMTANIMSSFRNIVHIDIFANKVLLNVFDQNKAMHNTTLSHTFLRNMNLG